MCDICWFFYTRPQFTLILCQFVASFALRVMSPTQHVMDVTQSTSVSPTTPVRMEVHVSLETAATATTTAHVLPTPQGKTVRVCSKCLLLEGCCKCVIIIICSQKSSHSHAVCSLSCPPGHVPNSTCSGCNPVHICVTNDPCQNGATCVIGNSSNTDYNCSCVGGYSGMNCGGKTFSETYLCHCHLIPAISVCGLQCSVGNEPNSDCSECTAVHVCLTNNPCQNGATCVIGTNSDYSCSCVQNYTGQNCESELSL